MTTLAFGLASQAQAKKTTRTLHLFNCTTKKHYFQLHDYKIMYMYSHLAVASKFVSYGICDQQRLVRACIYVQSRRSLCFVLTTTWPLRMTEHAHLILRRARRHFFYLTGLGVKIVIIIRVLCVRMMIYIEWIVVCFMIFFFFRCHVYLYICCFVEGLKEDWFAN